MRLRCPVCKSDRVEHGRRAFAEGPVNRWYCFGCGNWGQMAKAGGEVMPIG